MEQGKIDVKTLEELVDAGEIDTVLCMFTDLQGRFMGKRVVPHFFLEEVLGEEGLHACLYLLAIDMEMEPLPGYKYASWETGYGDFRIMYLPNSGLEIHYSTKWFQLLSSNAPASLEPDLRARQSLQDCLARRDPALEAALRHALK